MCVSCIGNYEQVGNKCERIKGEVEVLTTEIGLQSFYVDEHTLRHVFTSRDSKF